MKPPGPHDIPRILRVGRKKSYIPWTTRVFSWPNRPKSAVFFFLRSWADLSCFLKVISKIIFSIWLRRKPWMMEKLKNGGGISNQFFGYSIRNDCKWKKSKSKKILQTSTDKMLSHIRKFHSHIRKFHLWKFKKIVHASQLNNMSMKIYMHLS